MQFKPLSFFLRNGKIVRKVDYGNYISYQILVGNNKLLIVECRNNECVEVYSLDLRRINKKL